MAAAGKDRVAVDANTVDIAEWHRRRWKPRDIPHIRYAAELGIGHVDVENLNVEVIDMKG